MLHGGCGRVSLVGQGYEQVLNRSWDKSTLLAVYKIIAPNFPVCQAEQCVYFRVNKA